MGCLNARCFATFVLVLQLIAVTERQVIDFLGFMWTCIVINFLQIVFLIFGLFGVCQSRVKITIACLLWCFLWIGWNVFVICFYLEIGFLKKNDVAVLNMGIGGVSWWIAHGYGCQRATLTTITPAVQTVTSVTWPMPVNNMTTESFDSVALASSSLVSLTGVNVGCLIQYEYVEVIHAAVECLLACFAIVSISCVLHFLRVQYNASLLESQVVMGELEYIHMQQPASIDRRSVLQATSRSHQNYDVPLGPPVIQPLKSDLETSKNIPSDEDVASTTAVPSFRSRSHRKNKFALSSGNLGMTQVSPVLSVGRNAGAVELPYAVSGLAVRLPPTSRRVGREGQLVSSSTRSNEEYGFVISDGHQLPEATFI